MMTPVLLSLGPLKLYTLSLFLVAAFLWGGFVISKKAREYHVDEMQIYDGIVLSLFVGGGLAKLMEVVKLSELSFLGLWLGVVIAGIILTKKEEIRLFTILDIFSLGVLMAMSWWKVGEFWAGELRGRVVAGPWGLPFGEMRVFPVELLVAVLYLIAFVYAWRLERVYRTLSWYRGKKSSANTGFILGVALIMSGLINLVGSVLSQGVRAFVWFEMSFFIMAGMVVIYKRSGRKIRSDWRFLASKLTKKQ